MNDLEYLIDEMKMGLSMMIDHDDDKVETLANDDFVNLIMSDYETELLDLTESDDERLMIAMELLGYVKDNR